MDWLLLNLSAISKWEIPKIPTSGSFLHLSFGGPIIAIWTIYY